MTALQIQALQRAQTGQSLANYETIIDGFVSMGIAPDDIKPRENVFTFNAWKAAGRVVRKGEHGIPVLTMVPMQSRATEGSPAPQPDAPTHRAMRPKRTTVFHISQTQPAHEVRP